MNLIERLQDEQYANLIGEMINLFFESTQTLQASELINEVAFADMAEVIFQRAIKYEDPKLTAITGFFLGVYLAQKDRAILPSNIN